MKKLWLLIAVITVVSCKNEIPVDYAIVSGKITNKSNEDLIIASPDMYFKQIISVNEDGTFSDTLRVEPNRYIIYQGRNGVALFIENGNDLKVEFDMKNMDSSIVISGKGSEISNYLLAKIKKAKEIKGSGLEIYLKDESEYKAAQLEVKNSMTSILENSKGISDDFKAMELRNINYEYINELNIYEDYYKYYSKKEDFKVSEDFLKDVEKVLDFNNEEDYLYSKSYQDIVGSHYRNEANKLIEQDSISEDLASLMALSKATNATIKNKLLYNDAKYGITYTETLEDYYKFYMDNSTNEKQKSEITESYNKLKTVAKGQPSPKFVNYENFNGSTTSLDDFKGKYVYVDVWATWCGPCKREIPSLKEVEKKYHNKNIEFVSISVDKQNDHETWKKMVEDMELKGVQLFADKDWSSQFVQDYLIKGIPRFILIDTEGNIVNANAPRPSSEKLIELFNELKI
jgi:thiol-disulfide isomerase/thioredoxin